MEILIRVVDFSIMFGMMYGVIVLDPFFVPASPDSAEKHEKTVNIPNLNERDSILRHLSK